MSAAARLESLAGRPDRFPGVLLLTGPSPHRLEENARRLAAGLLCPGEDPDHRCDCCRRAEGGLHPDLLIVEPQGVQIRIDGVREALTFGAGKPYEASRRVAILSRAERLGPEAANALLKSLEEPGRHFHWILTTTRPETLLATIRSRCVSVALAPRSRADRVEAWLARGFSEDDASELAELEMAEGEDAPARLEDYRSRRETILRALRSGISERQIAPLLLLAETLAQDDPSLARLLAELLADAAVAAGASSDLLTHRAVAGDILELARRLPPEVLRRAALKAADAPSDTRRGNKRLHYESVLLDLLAELPAAERNE